MKNNFYAFRKRLLWWMLVLTLVLGYLIWRWPQPEIDFADGFPSKQMRQEQFSTKVVLGSLGGMRVSLPSHFANYLEYDGDPGWGEKRKGSTPVRSQESKLRSFGFDVRYPEMRGLDSSEMWAEKRSSKLSNTRWIRVGVTTGEYFPKKHFLDRLALAKIEKPGPYVRPPELYEKLDEMEHGLEVYAPKGWDEKLKTPYRKSDYAKDIFIHRDKAGYVDSFISCSNRNVEAPPCTHSFSLEPDAEAEITLIYRRQFLPEWQLIQESVRRKLVSFKAKAEP